MANVIRAEHYELALRRVSMANSFTSIRSITRINFSNIFEKINSIESILKNDAIYENMDFNTRNMYRNEIKIIAEKSKTSEVYVANKIFEIKTNEEHIGQYLFGDQKTVLLEALGIKKLKNEQTITVKTFEYIIAIYFQQ